MNMPTFSCTAEKGIFLCLIFLCGTLNARAQIQVSAEKSAYQLIDRIAPGYSSQFVVKIIPKDDTNEDKFIIGRKGDKILLCGNSGVSIASAFYYYLKHYTHSEISWNGSDIDLPDKLPLPEKTYITTSPYRYRYYFNYCTFNYSMSWWDWKRWEKEIDFMAMHGINLPLAITGQNIVWKKVYNRLGFSDDDLKSFYSGPAFFNWFWMGNLDGWGGPLSLEFMHRQEALQQKILKRERELGMTPILPAFTGHFPPAFKDKYPNAKLSKTASWNGFRPTYILNPNDPMFDSVGKLFIREETALYGTDHYYSADTFNENEPPSSDSGYLSGISRKVYRAMAEADNKAVWVMQGWLFYNAKDFWGQKQIQALLNPVPDDKMIILDLYTENHPEWRRSGAYCGKPWIWCMLHNFGGVQTLYGRMDEAATGPSRDMADEHKGNLCGIGITPEAIEQNPVMYELFLDNVWRKKPINVQEWLDDYVERRYGKKNATADSAWEILYHSVYTDTLLLHGGARSMTVARPTLQQSASYVDITKNYRPKDLVKAWQLLIRCAGDFDSSEGYRYDLVNVTRQVLSNYADDLQRLFAYNFMHKQYDAYRKYRDLFLNTLDDMDTLLSARREYLLGKWINDARSCATDERDKDIFEFNARNQVTLWGDAQSPLHEYANKEWNGLIRDFYKKRWQRFFKYLDECISDGSVPDMQAFDKDIRQWEWGWNEEHNASYLIHPAGKGIALSEKMFKKYYSAITVLYKK